MVTLPLFQKGRSGGMQFVQGDSGSHSRLFFAYLLAAAVFFVILFLRLFQLTVVKGEYYRRLSENNRIREFIIEPQRGEILDRKGFVVAKNIASDVKKIADRLTSKRLYESPEVIAPLVGYRQLADENDLKQDNCIFKLKLGDKVGKKGIERLYDCDLRGRNGEKLIEIDAKGQYLHTLSVIPPQSGNTISLSFDLYLQQKAYELLKNLPAGRQVKKAAAVAVDPRTGEVLFLVSTPSFNPQFFEDGQSEAVKNYFENVDKPLFNRVTSGTYPPGSIFKLMVATASLEEGAIDEKTQFEDTGILHAGPLTFGNWYFLQYGKTEGMVDIVKAIRRSNDIFFYQAGDKVGVEKVKKWAEIFGYGKKTGIGFEEQDGLIPSPFWKQDTMGDRWYLGDTYNFSIGQGYLSVTPLQVTMATAAFANGGNLCQPKLLKDEPANCKKLPISPKTLSLIREGMKEACSPGGTGWPLFEFKPQTACKTGTAESQAKSGLPHAWFTVFAPYEDPQIALTILIEEGGQGSDVAGPIAKELLKAYFERSE